MHPLTDSLPDHMDALALRQACGEIEAQLRAEVERLRGALKSSVDLAEFWINREDRRGMSETDYKIWHALGYGSNAIRNARAALEATK